MAKANIGQGKQSLALAGGGVAGYLGSGTVTYAATSVTYAAASGWVASTSTNFGTAGVWTGYIVVAGSVYGVITANTTTVLTVDQWYNPATPTGAAGTTPSANTTFVIIPGNAPVYRMALTADTTAIAGTETALTSEITTAGLKRQAAAYAHTYSNSSANNSYTLTGSYTAQAGDVPVTVHRIGTFDAVSGGTLFHITNLSADATLSAAGDQLTVTQTVTM